MRMMFTINSPRIAYAICGIGQFQLTISRYTEPLFEDIQGLF